MAWGFLVVALCAARAHAYATGTQLSLSVRIVPEL